MRRVLREDSANSRNREAQVARGGRGSLAVASQARGRRSRASISDAACTRAQYPDTGPTCSLTFIVIVETGEPHSPFVYNNLAGAAKISHT